MGAFAAAQAGDALALQSLTREHMPLVQALCARVARASRDMEELFQQGCLGLVKAIRQFDEARGVAFSTYAVPVILGELRAFYRALSPLRQGWRERQKQLALRRAREALTRRLRREPAIGEVAAACGLAPAEAACLLELRVVSLDRPDEAGESWWERIPDPRAGAWLERFLLRDLVSRLPLTERRLLYLRYVRGRTQADTAAALSMTQSQVSRREARTRLRLRHEWLE